MEEAVDAIGAGGKGDVALASEATKSRVSSLDAEDEQRRQLTSAPRWIEACDVRPEPAAWFDGVWRVGRRGTEHSFATKNEAVLRVAVVTGTFFFFAHGFA